MKTQIKKKIIGLAVVTLLTLSAGLSSAHAQATGSHGGGGIVRSGQYLTFGDTDFRLELKPLDQVPGLEKLQGTLMNIPIPRNTLGKLIKNVYNLGDRKYFAINPSDLDSGSLSKIYSIYNKLLGNSVDNKNLVIYAVTSGTETYLLPQFFMLNETQQASILFHEALWATNPYLTYKFVVDAEMKFQHYLEKGASGYDLDLMRVFDSLFGEESQLTLASSLGNDLKTGALNGLVRDGDKIFLHDLFPTSDLSNVGCFRQGYPRDHRAWAVCRVLFEDGKMQLELIDMMRRFPNSALLKSLYINANNIAFEFVKTEKINGEWGAQLAKNANKKHLKFEDEINKVTSSSMLVLMNQDIVLKTSNNSVNGSIVKVE